MSSQPVPLYQIKNKVFSASLLRTAHQSVGFTREQIVQDTQLPKVEVDKWIKILIDSEDILVDTSGMLRVDPGYIG